MKSVGVHRALATTFEVHADGRLAHLIETSYADLAAPSAAAQHLIEVRTRRGQFTTLLDGATREQNVVADAALHDVRRAVNRLAMDSVAATDTVLNAAAVEVGGKVFAIVGVGGAGKSTLAGHLVLQGHGYVADDVVAIDPDGHVRPYHRPLGVRRPQAARLGVEVPPGPFELGWPMRVAGRAPLSPGGSLHTIIVVHRVDDGTWVQALTPAEALVKFADQALLFPGGERRAFQRLEALARRGTAVSLFHHDLREAAAQIDRLAAEIG